MPGGRSSWDLRTRGVARRDTSCTSVVHCLFTEGRVRGWRPIPCKRPPRRSTTCCDHARDSLRTLFVLEREHANDGVQISPQAQRRSRRPGLAPQFQLDDCGPRVKHITSSQLMHGHFQEYFRGSDCAMTHTCQSMPHENLKLRHLET